MDFHDRSFDGFHCISNSDGGVRVSSGVQNDAIIRKTHFLKLVNKFSFDVGLEMFDGNCTIFFLKLLQKFRKGQTAIQFRFPGAQEIEIRTIDDDEVRHKVNISKIEHKKT